DDGDLRRARPPSRGDCALRTVGIDGAAAHRGAFLEMEWQRRATGLAAVEVIALFLIVLRFVRRRLLPGGVLAISELGMAAEHREAFREAAAVDDYQPEVLERIDHVGLERERAPVGRFGLSQLALFEEDIAAIALPPGIV